MKPSFATTIAALRTTDPRYPWVQPTADEADAADALEIVEQLHQPALREPDRDGGWGPCASCPDQSWPCPIWVDHEQLAVQWLGRAADRVVAHARRASRRGRSA